MRAGSVVDRGRVPTMSSLKIPACLLAVLLSLSLASADQDTRDWMRQAYARRGDTLLRDVVIPGTHDSGTYGMTAASALAPGRSEWRTLARTVVARWSVTQHRTIAEQLEDGIRALDLRIDHHDGKLVIVHGLVGPTLEDVFDQVRDFSKAHPKEIVILDLHRMPAPEHFDELEALLEAKFGGRMISVRSVDTLTFNHFWKHDKGILMLVNSVAFSTRKPHYWNKGSHYDNHWANTTDKSTLWRSADARSGNPPTGKLFNVSLTLTPDAKVILPSLRSAEGLHGWLSRSGIMKTPAEWLPRWLGGGPDAARRHVNIVNVDFYDETELVRIAIEHANRGKAP